MKRELRIMLAVLCLALAAGLCGLFGPSALADGIEMHEPKYYYIVGVRDLSGGTYSSCNNSAGYIVVPLYRPDGTISSWTCEVGEGDWDTENGEWFYAFESGPYSSMDEAHEHNTLKRGFPSEVRLTKDLYINSTDYITNGNINHSSYVEFTLYAVSPDLTDKITGFNYEKIQSWREKTVPWGGHWSDDKIVDDALCPTPAKIGNPVGPSVIYCPTSNEPNKYRYTVPCYDQYNGRWPIDNDPAIVTYEYTYNWGSLSLPISDEGDMYVYATQRWDDPDAPVSKDIRLTVRAGGQAASVRSLNIVLYNTPCVIQYSSDPDDDDNYPRHILAASDGTTEWTTYYSKPWMHTVDRTSKEPDADGHYTFVRWKTNQDVRDMKIYSVNVLFKPVFEKEAHSFGYSGSKEATCTEDGYLEEHCWKCYYYRKNVYPALGHDPVEWPAVAPTCENEGRSKAVFYCSRCGKYFTTAGCTTETTLEAVTIQRLGHDWGNPTYSWNEDYSECTVTRVCRNDSSHRDVVTKTSVPYDDHGTIRGTPGVSDVSGSTDWDGGWWVVRQNTQLTGRVEVTGNVNLILADGAALTIQGGIHVPLGSMLTIWPQSGGTGRLNVTMTNTGCAGIGGNTGFRSGNVTIHGGVLSVQAGYSASGIGGGSSGGAGHIWILGGTVNITADENSSGIGAGINGLGGMVDITNCTLTAAAAGSGIAVSADEISLGGCMKVTAGSSQAAAQLLPFSEGNTGYGQLWAKIEPCAAHTFGPGAGGIIECRHCGVLAAGFGDFLSGSGTEGNPWKITSSDDWNLLAAGIDLGFDTAGATFRQTKDISVTRELGLTSRFAGTYDGGGKTLTVSLSSDGACGPFRLSNAVIRHLRVAGTVSGGNHSAGLVVGTAGTCLIEDCAVGVSVTCTGNYCGGVIGHAGTSATTLRGVVFTGSLSGASNAATLWGWSDTGATPVVQHCLDASNSTFPIGLGFPNPGSGVSNTYYLREDKTAGASRAWGNRGKLARTVTAWSGVNADFSPLTVFSASGLSACSAGLVYNGVFYAGDGETVSLGLSRTEASMSERFTVSAGTLTKAGSAWTLTMPQGENAVIGYEPLTGDGSQSSPLTIHSADEWNDLANAVENGYVTAGKRFALAESISVTTMIGPSEHPFCGALDGANRTLTFTAADAPDDCAPFRWVDGASFSNLHIAGRIQTANRWAAGLAANVHGECVITNCRSSVTIASTHSGDGTHAGFVSVIAADGSLVMQGCAFDGAITGADTTHCGGFVGYGRNSVAITDSVFAPTAFEPAQSQTFARKTSTCAVTIGNSYYLTAAPNDSQGLRGYAVTAGEGVTLGFGTPAAYSASGISAYPVGLSFGGVFHAGEAEALSLTPALADSIETPEGCVFGGFTSSAGLLKRSGEGWSLTMPATGVTIDALFAPAFGTPDFTLPGSLKAIEAEAFENASMTALIIPASCASIGDRAFRDCRFLTQIRIPADCALGEDVFDGCTLVYVYGVAGSPAEDYCLRHGNCVFVEE